MTAGDAGKLAQLAPGSKEFVDPAAYADMRTFRKPFIILHYYVFYVLLLAVLVHIAAAVLSEKRGSGLISAMFSGRKAFAEEPVDLKK